MQKEFRQFDISDRSSSSGAIANEPRRLKTREALNQEASTLVSYMLNLASVDSKKFLIPEDTKNSDPKVISHLINTANLAIEYVGPNPSIERAREFLGYPLNLLYMSLLNSFADSFQPMWSPSGRVLSFIGEGFSQMAPVWDSQLNRYVLPHENVEESLRLLDLGEETFTTLLFVTKEDDLRLPIQEDGGERWKFISTKNGGVGVVFCDDPKIKFGVMMGERYFPKTAIKGVYEVLAEECNPWHFWSCEWSFWKECAAWSILGRHTESHPFEQKRFREIIEEEGLELYELKDLIYSWRETARQKGKKYSAYYAYYSGEVAFLIMAAHKKGDSSYFHNNYQEYSKLISEFTTMVRSRIADYKDTSKSDIMMPILLEWVGISDENELFSMVNAKIRPFSEEFRKANKLLSN